MKNPNCDNEKCRSATGEVRVYPLGGGGNPDPVPRLLDSRKQLPPIARSRWDGGRRLPARELGNRRSLRQCVKWSGHK